MRLGGRCFVSTALLMCALVFFTHSQALFAREIPPLPAKAASLEARRDALFRQMLADPADLDIAFSYATISIRLGDYEGAITALERMLIFAPGLPRIQLELGVLYYRLGSYATAEDYFDRAMSGDNVPDIVRRRVALYVAKIKNKQQRHAFSGTVTGGFRIQSNANSGPGSNQVNLNGVTFTLDNESVGKAGVNAFFASSLHYEYDLHRQGDLLEADFLFYGAKYVSFERLDTAVAEVTLGPSFNMQRFGINKTQLGVYGIGNAVGLEDNLYFGTVGAGLRFVNRASATRSLRLKAEYRRKWYNNTPRRLTATNKNGHELSAEIALASTLNSSLLVHGKLRLVREEVRAVFFDNLQMGGEIGASFSLPSPVRGKGAMSRNWLLDITGGYRYVRYDKPDPSINAAKRQSNNEYFARTRLIVPVASGVSLMPQVEYRKVDSSYGIYKYQNFSATLGIGYKF